MTDLPGGLPMDALEAAQAELEEWRFTNKIDELQRANEGLHAEVARLTDKLADQQTISGNWKARAEKALARLAEIDKQEPVAEMALVDMGIGDARQLRVHWLMDGYLDVGAKLFAAAGASPVQPLPTMDDALAAGDGCLHGLIDKLQARVAELEGRTSQALEPVLWQYRWTNPAGGDEPAQMLKWKDVVPAWNQTTEHKCTELKSYRYAGKPTYEVRGLYDSPPSQALELSDEEIQAIWVETGLDECDPETFARAIIAAISAKGDGK